ncbi:hypothetical protein FA13DRAFT_1086852 [Coprinellus micaceus]|uniref:Uncharacterized protein n=1 Tax=Coprinellus micaceus TaxID=71717 RepID=A0A4Y7TRL1_COPMI|nr:hypothetical protein FA13DRAFT_1086852 [Coprinellus micaceus]
MRRWYGRMFSRADASPREPYRRNSSAPLLGPNPANRTLQAQLEAWLDLLTRRSGPSPRILGQPVEDESKARRLLRLAGRASEKSPPITVPSRLRDPIRQLSPRCQRRPRTNYLSPPHKSPRISLELSVASSTTGDDCHFLSPEADSKLATTPQARFRAPIFGNYLHLRNGHNLEN